MPTLVAVLKLKQTFICWIELQYWHKHYKGSCATYLVPMPFSVVCLFVVCFFFFFSQAVGIWQIIFNHMINLFSVCVILDGSPRCTVFASICSIYSFEEIRVYLQYLILRVSHTFIFCVLQAQYLLDTGHLCVTHLRKSSAISVNIIKLFVSLYVLCMYPVFNVSFCVWI